MLKLFVTMQTMFIAGADRLKGDSERGATATEYALLVALIAFALILGVTAFGGALNDFFDGLATTVGGWPTS
ncbi:Flp family type IVb pilin [Arthrobacter sp. HY1533]|uniref:Flp family type IVb pilin n=1 Tax=Arthrobacter sp. HY1533 TaxID=2970919 RepID=UPI0022B9EE8E|nr:Flp family type IVb pilin [Arthrobacter sp. HY1533]